MSIDLGGLDRSVLAPGAKQEMQPRDHFVELYEDDASLIESIRIFLSAGIIQGDAAVVIAEPPHRKELEAALKRSIDLEAARARGLFISLDAQDTLGAFIEDGLPDTFKFGRVIGSVLERASASGYNVRVFGEMVALLWKQGNVAGALALEDLWNELSEEHDFRLFCGYPTSAFEDGDLSAVTEVCSRHSAVLTAQSSAQ
jgi:hypothetical protein